MTEDEFFFNNYNKIKILGKGSFGKAILYENKLDKSKIVIKIMNLENRNEKLKEKIIQEGKILFKLHHQYIIKFEKFFYTTQKAYLFMEYAEGGNLREKLERIKNNRTKFGEKRLITIFYQLCQAVKYCHDNKIIHRDLKASNIFFDKAKVVKLGDFGLSAILDENKKTVNSLVGTPIYMGPEVYMEVPYSYSCDIWSLGIILYELCFLENPFDHLFTSEQIYDYILKENIFKECKKYSMETNNLMRKLLQKNPSRRPSIDEVVKNCEDILKNLEKPKIRLKEYHPIQLLDLFPPILFTKKFEPKQDINTDEKIELNDDKKGFNKLVIDRIISIETNNNKYNSKGKATTRAESTNRSKAIENLFFVNEKPKKNKIKRNLTKNLRELFIDVEDNKSAKKKI